MHMMRKSFSFDGSAGKKGQAVEDMDGSSKDKFEKVQPMWGFGLGQT